MKFLVLLMALMVSSEAIADLSYYPSTFHKEFSQDSLKGEELREKIYTVLIKKHVSKNKMNDELVDDCGQAPANGSCYGQKTLGYRGARKVLFGKLHLDEDSRGYFIKDVYCRKDFTSSANVGPNMIPDHSKINCEHTWPQSKFSKQFDSETQKSDLNHLYPTDSRANSTRGNYEFAEGGTPLDGCGSSRSAGDTFEPPEEHKGNVARALFYFSVRYKMPISAAQEAYLRDWHRRDPVDAAERERNEWVHRIQGNRNPFIDYPHLVDSISNF